MNNVQLRSDGGLAQPAVVITGGAEGIGRALAELFAKDGNNLLLVARDEAKLARTAAELTKAYPVIVKVTSQDLTTEEGRAGVEQALRRFGLYADILVNNAGMMSHGFFQDVDTATVHRLLDLDIRAVVDLTHRFLPGMLARRRGGVLNLASMMGFMPVPYQAIYAASKAFVLSFSKALAYETMGTGIRVSVVAPGVVATKLHAKAGTQNSRYLYLFPNTPPEKVARIAYSRFKRGWSVIVPGWANWLSTIAIRFVPDFLLVPLMGWFFRMRDEEGNVLWPNPLPEPATPERAVESAHLHPVE
jgi:short-subunit dehydrogenase